MCRQVLNLKDELPSTRIEQASASSDEHSIQSPEWKMHFTSL